MIKDFIPIEGFKDQRFNLSIEKLDEAVMGEVNSRVPHRHTYYEVFIFLKGGGTHKIDFNEYRIEDNALHFISPGQVHLIRRAESCRGYAITFTDELYAFTKYHKNILEEISLYHNYERAPIITIDDKEMRTVLAIIENIEKEYNAGTRFSEELMCSFLNILLIKCERKFMEAGAEYGRQRSAAALIMQNFRNHLNANFRKVQNVSGYADLMSITAGHLNEVIKKDTGINASKHIDNRIILEAKRLLFNTEKSVKEIAFTLSFDDPTYFVRFFKKYTRQTPGVFRDMIRKKYHE